MKAVKSKLWTLDQLMNVASCAHTIFNERHLCVMEIGDANMVPLTPNSLTLGQFVHGLLDSDEADPDFPLPSAKCVTMHKRLRDTLTAVHKCWTSEYMGFLARKDASRQKSAPCTKSLIIPKINDWILVKDNSRDPKLGKITKLIDSDDGEIRKVILKINESENIYPVTNLKLLKCHSQSSMNEGLHSDVIKINAKPQHNAAKRALQRMKNITIEI